MTSINDFLANAAKAVENGLSRDDAVRALTLRPAEILGVGSQLGSIEVGKIANLTVTRGDLLDKTRRIAHVFIDGRPIELRPASPAAAGGGAPASGTWNVTINLGSSGNEKQELSATLNLQQQGDRISGSVQGQLGSGMIANGSITGSDVNFTVPITLPAPASQTTDAIFNGTINGNTMSGSVQIIGRGPGTFTGTRAAGAGPPAPAATPPAGGAAAAPPATAAASLSGMWTVSASVGPQQITSMLTLQQQGDRLTGRLENDHLGTSEISDGSVTSNRFRFSTTANFGGQSISLAYEGTVSGNQMNGTVTTPQGSIPFTGTRNP